jgi:hypothetical protein
MADRPRLTLEDYVLFFTTRTGQGLTLDHLNQVRRLPPPIPFSAYARANPCSLLSSSRQIIYMHAFVKLHREKKVPVIPLSIHHPLCSVDH